MLASWHWSAAGVCAEPLTSGPGEAVQHGSAQSGAELKSSKALWQANVRCLGYLLADGVTQQAINPFNRLQACLAWHKDVVGASKLRAANHALGASARLSERCAPAMSRRSVRSAQPAGAADGTGGASAMQALGALQASFLANGQAMEAIKCCEAACELQSSRGDQNREAHSRLALARLLLQHTNNLLAARKQLDRAVLLPRLCADYWLCYCTAYVGSAQGKSARTVSRKF